MNPAARPLRPPHRQRGPASALAPALATAASADPVGEAFVVEQYAYAPSAAWGNGTTCWSSPSPTTRPSAASAPGVSGSTSPVLPGEDGEIAFNTSRDEWLVVASDRSSVRATVIAADGTPGEPVTLATAPEDERCGSPRWPTRVGSTS